MIEIRVLGCLELWIDGIPTAFPEAVRSRALLGWLAVHPGVHARGELATRLRPDVIDESARKSLRQAVWGLRSSLSDADRIVVTGRDAVGLADDVRVDLREVRRRIRAGDDRAAQEVLGRELLPGIDEEWVLGERVELADEVDGALSRLAEAARRSGDGAALLEWTRARARFDPLGEAPQRALMVALSEQGDRAAALAAFDRFRDRLRRELDTLPSAETRRLADDLRRGAWAPSEGAPGMRHETPRELAAALRTTGPIAGRSAALERLRRAWAHASSRPRVALLVGEPGIGKTRLAAEIAGDVSARGARVLYGRCDQERLQPYQPFVEALASAQGGPARFLGASLPPSVDAASLESARFAAFEGVRESLESVARSCPTLLVLDDLHWADVGSLALLRHLAGHLADVPLLVLGTFRDTDVAAGDPLLIALGDVRRCVPVDQLSLSGLDVAAVEEIVRDRGGDETGLQTIDASHLRARTAGNPLFVTELLHYAGEEEAELAGGVPPGVEQVLSARLERLGPEAVSVLTTAAAIGNEFELDLLESCAPEPTAAWDVEAAVSRATAAGLVTDADRFGASSRFAHALVADALLARVSRRSAATLHARIGRALLDTCDADASSAVRVAHHLRAGAATGVFDEALEWSRRAADELKSAMAFAEAADVLAETLEMLAQLSSGEHAATSEILLELGEAQAYAGERAHARETFRDAHRRAVVAGDAHVAARAALGIGGLGTVVTTTDRETVSALEQALQIQPAERAADRARLLARMSIEVYYGDRERADVLSREAIDTARDGGATEALPGALNARRVAIWDAEHAEERLSVSEAMIAAADVVKDEEAALQGRNWRVVDLLELGRVVEAEAEITHYERHAASRRFLHYAWYVPLWRAALADMRGAFDDGARLRADALATGRRSGDANVDLFVSIQANQSLVEQGRLGEVDIEALTEAATRSAVPSAWWAWLAQILGMSHRRDEARMMFEAAAQDDFATLPRDANWHVVCEACEAAALLGDAGRATLLYEMLAPYAHLFPVTARAVTCYGPAHYYLGRVAATASHQERAVEHFRAAAVASDAIGAKPRAALSRARLGELGQDDSGAASSDGPTA